MEIKVPDLGVDSAEVSEIMVKVGDTIAVDDNLVLLESDKASVEVPATASGTITAIAINVGDNVKEGDVILTVESAGGEQPTPALQDTATPQAPVQQTTQTTAPAASAAPTTSQSSQSRYPLPDLGVDEAEVAEIMVKVGDMVEKDQPIVLVESDKASVEVPAPVAGTIAELLINAGDKVKNGQDFIVIAQSDASAAVAAPAQSTPSASESAPAQSAAQSAPAPTASTEATYPLPDLGVDSADVSELMVKEGDTVEKDQPIVLVESDKASVEVPAPAAGKVVKLLIKAGDKVSNGQDFIVIQGEGGSSVPAQSPASPSAPQAASTPVAAPASVQSQPVAQTTTATTTQLTEAQVNEKLAGVYAGPAVRKLARQLGVDITQVKGTGQKGRLDKDDLYAYVKQRMQAPATPQTAISQAVGGASGAMASLPKLPDMSKVEVWGEIERQDLSKLQKVSIPQLNYNTLLPQVTQFDLADITDVEKMRVDIKEEMKKQGVSLTILAFIMKAVAYAIGEHPKFNSHLSDDNTQILIRKSVHMGFAVATPTGLTVPVIKDVQSKGIKQIAKEIGEMAAKARDNKLTPKDMTGASFTISSQGNMGGTYFTPLVTWPQVAILGVSESTMQPRWNGKEFEPRLMLPLSLSYDHRVINGADAAVFTRLIAKLLADPRRILL